MPFEGNVSTEKASSQPLLSHRQWYTEGKYHPKNTTERKFTSNNQLHAANQVDVYCKNKKLNCACIRDRLHEDCMLFTHCKCQHIIYRHLLRKHNGYVPHMVQVAVARYTVAVARHTVPQQSNGEYTLCSDDSSTVKCQQKQDCLQHRKLKLANETAKTSL